MLIRLVLRRINYNETDGRPTHIKRVPDSSRAGIVSGNAKLIPLYKQELHGL